MTIDSEMLHQVLAYDRMHPLLFNTGLFLLLFAAFILIYQAMRRWPTAKMLFVILFSLYFYYKNTAAYCFILLGVCISDFILGRAMGAFAHNKSVQKGIVALNVVVNVGMLVYFKYFSSVWDMLRNFTGADFDALDIILPVGVSFFTFRSISYIVDIYRGHLKPATNFLQYCFYLTFFPPLLAGPVVRAKDMLPQIASNPVATRAMVSEGLFLIIAGLIKKVVVADYISGNFVDRIFENPSLYTGFENMMGAIGFALQLYCDFSGYSDMAIGIALLLGYRFKDNFNAPYKSQSPTEFWKRWHISLSSWLMDYLYIPLGGNRKGKWRQRANLMTTMLLGGLWHGDTIMYLIWGGYHGSLLVGHKALKKRGIGLPQRWRGTQLARTGNIILTFILVVIGFVFFRARSMDQVSEMGTAIFTNFHPEVLPQFVAGYWAIVVVMALAFVVHFLPDKLYQWAMRTYASIPLLVQALILGIIIFIVIQTRQSSLVPFIYLQY